MYTLSQSSLAHLPLANSVSHTWRRPRWARPLAVTGRSALPAPAGLGDGDAPAHIAGDFRPARGCGAAPSRRPSSAGGPGFSRWAACGCTPRPRRTASSPRNASAWASDAVQPWVSGAGSGSPAASTGTTDRRTRRARRRPAPACRCRRRRSRAACSRSPRRRSSSCTPRNVRSGRSSPAGAPCRRRRGCSSGTAPPSAPARAGAKRP